MANPAVPRSGNLTREQSSSVQGTESDELGALTCVPAALVPLLQIIERRQTPFQFFQILAHGASFGQVSVHILSQESSDIRLSPLIRPASGWPGGEKFLACRLAL
jgi:hypothetical protein